MSSTPVTMKLEQAAAHLTVHPETLRRMAVANEIPSARIRSRWSIPSQFVEDWATGNRDLWNKTPDGHWYRKQGSQEALEEVSPFRSCEQLPIPPSAR